MDAPMSAGTEKVHVGVVFTGTPEDKDCVVISEDGHSVAYTSAKNKETKSFVFDQVLNVDDIQLLANLFGRMLSQEKEEMFISVSFLQFYPDGSAVDLLSTNRHSLKLVTHPVLGRLVGGVCEVCVGSQEDACALYESCKGRMRARGGVMSSRCSSLFSVLVERKIHVEEEEFDVCRSRLQLFSLAGGASRIDLRGVNPLAKVVEQIPCGTPTADTLLPLLLHEALTGNSRSFLVYCINPQGLLDNETPSALTLAQKVQSFSTTPTVGRWCPRATEQEIRQKIMDLQLLMMSQGQSEDHNTHRLAELTQNLQIVKKQSWEWRREQSKKIKGKTQIQQSGRSPNGSRPSSDYRESTDAIQYLQDQLKVEMEEHIREGRGDAEKVQERVARIQELKEALREETLRNSKDKSDLCQQFNDHSQMEYNKAKERRRQLKEDHGRLIHEEVEKMERDLAKEELPPEGPQRELLVLTRERRVLVLQMEALRMEALQAETDLQEQYHRHQKELSCLREESLQVFRVFRQVNEEHRKMSESRYRCLLLEAVQDAVYLSAQNQQLQTDNKQLHKALGELKDALAVRVDSPAEQQLSQ
ncbi:kinesin klp-20 isoform X1 [Solea senegalensis]|uniref:Kinesin klp-20 isoform X1 n=2 Tax=Solea senegalensis TaxID=28829 RepID=A0AAV6SP69_SOLSE|nr:kinesin klp-20 isoform X1 [Solea senegalensis]